MISKWGWKVRQLTRKLWFRATLISLLAVAAALASLLISPYLPQGLSAQIGADAVDNILGIIASSMLAVTTFSLSTMVAAYSAATSNVTPRATKLLIEDKTTQNVLATFVGSFLYSVVAIITLAMGAYGERGRVVLFAMTILVVALIVVTLLRWIDYLLGLGRVGQTTEEVEEAATTAMRERRKRPNLGGMPAERLDNGIPQNATPVFSEKIGYVQHVDVGALDDDATAAKGRIYLAALPGTFVDRKRPLAWCSGFQKTPDTSDIAAAFSIGQERSFDQDPRFGLCVMAEIAQRALSPALNDPGTAIDIIGRAVRVLSIWTEPEDEKPDVMFKRVYVPSIRIEDLFDDVLTPIARDAAGNVEVQIRLQKAYAALARAGDPRFREVALAHSKVALARAKAAVASEQDFRRVRASADDVGWKPDRPPRRLRSGQGAVK
jgi:uncharacterized membrane protein